ncbi:MAG TPA: hypothetical protein VHI31_04270 [Actinomycetota bacterium]|nr:hypothetical protein [Actinomycetota bacterium]
MDRATGARWDQIRLRAKRLRYRYAQGAGLLVRSGRRTILKLSAHHPLANNFTGALLTIRALHVPSGKEPTRNPMHWLVRIPRSDGSACLQLQRLLI